VEADGRRFGKSEAARRRRNGNKKRKKESFERKNERAGFRESHIEARACGIQRHLSQSQSAEQGTEAKGQTSAAPLDQRKKKIMMGKKIK
jgi:hypothetical protein